MRLSDAYRLLDLQPGASEEEVKRAWRDLTKVWHPDRFGHDESLRRKAQEKLQEINEAVETISRSRQNGWDGRAGTGGRSSGGEWRVRSGGTESAAGSIEAIIGMAERGEIGEDAEIFHPSIGRWVALRDLPEVRLAMARVKVRRYLSYVITCAALALVFLFRRPTPTGLAIAALLFGVAFYFISRMKQLAAELRRLRQ